MNESVTHKNGWCHTYNQVLVHIWRSHAHFPTSHVTHVNEFVAYLRIIHVIIFWKLCGHVWHYSFICVTWLIHSDMTYSYVWHDSFTRVTQLIAMCAMHVWHDAFIRVTWLIHTCNTTHSHVWHNTLPCAPCMCDMTHLYVWHDSFTLCDTTHSHVWHISMPCHVRMTDTLFPFSSVRWFLFSCFNFYFPAVNSNRLACIKWNRYRYTKWKNPYFFFFLHHAQRYRVM